MAERLKTKSQSSKAEKILKDPDKYYREARARARRMASEQLKASTSKTSQQRLAS